MDKSLKGKAISIKGKAYVLVSDRVVAFNELFENGSIVTNRMIEGDREIFCARVTPDCNKPDRFFTGWSQAIWGDGYINKTSALENAETSAVGRALAMMGIGVIDSIASVDEIKKAESTTGIKNWKKEISAINDINILREYMRQNSGLGEEFSQACVERSKLLKNENV